MSWTRARRFSQPNSRKESKMKSLNLFLALSAVFLLVSCSSSRTIKGRTSIPTSINELVKRYYTDYEWRLPGSEEQASIYLFDRTAVLTKHRDEMIRTLEI